MTKFNKASAAAISTALMAVVGAFWNPGPEVLGAINTLVVTALVFFIPNQG